MFKLAKFAKLFLSTLVFIVLFVFFSINNIKNKKPASIDIFFSEQSSSFGSIYGITYNDHPVLYNTPNYFKELVYKKSTAEPDSAILLKIRGREYLIRNSQYKNNIKIIGQDSFYSLTKGLDLSASPLPYFNKIINFEGHTNYFLRLFASPIILLLVFAYLFTIFFSRFFSFKNKLSTHTKWTHSTLFKVVEIASFVFLFFVLMHGNQYYFLQDDNYIQFSPVITESLHDFYATGRWPNYNFYQHAGLPTAGYSIYSLNYIGTHISFLIAKFFLADANHFCTVFAFIHFFIGFYFLQKFFRLLNISPPLALVASLCFVFSGFNVMASRSWYYIAPSVAFVPLLLYLRLLWHRSTSLKQALFFGVMIALYAYSGNVQFWAYTIIIWLFLELGYFFTKQQKLPVKFIFLSLAVGFILFAPQAYLTIYETTGLERKTDISLNLFLGINQMIHPLKTSTVVVDDWAGPLYSEYNWVFFKCCFLFGIICFWVLFQFLFGKKTDKIMIPLILLFFILLLYGCGKYGIIAPLTMNLPILKLFTHPFKIMLFLNLILILVGVYYVNKISNIKWISAISLLLLANLCWQVVETQSAFHMYGYKEPYKKLPYLSLLDKHVDYRVLPVGTFRSFDENYAFCMQHNFATKYRLPSLESLEVLNPKDIDFKNHYADFSVRYIIQYHNQSQSIKQFGSNIYFDSLKNKDSLQLIYNDSFVSLYETKNYTPLVVCYDKDRIVDSKPTIDYATTKLTISYAEKIMADKVLLTLNYRKPLTVYLDGKLAPVTSDFLNRAVVTVSKPFNKIEVKYTYL